MSKNEETTTTGSERRYDGRSHLERIGIAARIVSELASALEAAEECQRALQRMTPGTQYLYQHGLEQVRLKYGVRCDHRPYGPRGLIGDIAGVTKLLGLFEAGYPTFDDEGKIRMAAVEP